MLKPKHVVDFILRRGAILLSLWVVLATVGSYYSFLLYKNLRTDIEELLPKEARSGKDLKQLTNRMESFDYIAVLTESDDPEVGKKFLDVIVEKGKRIPTNLLHHIEYRVSEESEFFRKRAGFMMDMPDLLKVRDYIRDRIKWDKEFYSPFNIFPVNDRIKKPELDTTEMADRYSAGPDYPGGYYATPNGKKRVALFYLAGKHSDIHNAHALRDQVKAIVTEANPSSFPGLQVHYTGGVESFLEEHEALMADLELSTIVVLLLVTAVIIVFYNSVLATLGLLACLLIGTATAFGVSYFIVGFLNANSAFLGSIIIGNGINFGIIFIARYLEERRRGLYPLRAMRKSMVATGPATFTAALAAGFAYGSLAFTRFQGFRQFGIIGLTGMVICWIAAYTALPAMILGLEKAFPARFGRALKKKQRSYLAGFLAQFVYKHPKTIFFSSLALAAVFIPLAPRIGPHLIETDLSKLRSKESLRDGAGFYDHYITEIFAHYLTETVILTKSREQSKLVAEKLRARKKSDPTSEIGTVRIFDDFIPTQQEEKVAIIRDLQKQMTPQVMNALDAKERRLVKDLKSPESDKPFTEKDLPKLVVQKFTEKDGSLGHFVVVEPPFDPKDDIAWDGKRLIRYVSVLREVVDTVEPGMPVAGQLTISADMVASIMEDGPLATMLAFTAVVLLVVVLFRQVKTIAAALFALLLGTLWLAICVLGFRLKINFLNFIALPITFGIGVDYGVNILQRYRETRLKGKRDAAIDAVRETGGAVMLASLTTIIGYGSLVIASNRAFISFGTLAVLGEVTCITAAVLSLPAMLEYLDRKKVASKSSQRRVHVLTEEQPQR